jgi:hypothetical protein
MVETARIAALALVAGAGVALASPAGAGFGGGGGDGGPNGGGDFAIRAELQNPRFIEPGSPYGYFRSYSRGPAYPYPYPPRAHRYYHSYGAPYLYEYQGW